jgi:hypothetical protein
MKILVPQDKCKSIPDMAACWNAGRVFLDQDGKYHDNKSIKEAIIRRETVIMQLDRKYAPGQLILVYCHDIQNKERTIIDRFNANGEPKKDQDFFGEYGAKFGMTRLEAVIETTLLTILKAQQDLEQGQRNLQELANAYNGQVMVMDASKAAGVDLDTIDIRMLH